MAGAAACRRLALEPDGESEGVGTGADFAASDFPGSSDEASAANPAVRATAASSSQRLARPIRLIAASLASAASARSS